MLAEVQKTVSLELQRKDILMKVHDCRGAAFTYIGELYSETKAYFEHEGYDIKELPLEQVISITEGLPMYVFKVKNNIKLKKEPEIICH